MKPLLPSGQTASALGFGAGVVTLFVEGAPGARGSVPVTREVKP